jgi:hypothetical protein
MNVEVTLEDRRLVRQLAELEPAYNEWNRDYLAQWAEGEPVPDEAYDYWMKRAQLVANYRIAVSTEGKGRHLVWRALTEEFDERPMWSLRPAEEDNEAISSMLDGTVWWDEETGWSTWDGDGDSLSFGDRWQTAFETAERIYGCTADRPADPSVRPT